MDEQGLKTGTTTVGIVCKDCVILAADKRATAGNLIANKNMLKVVPINDTLAVTTAGSVSEIQLMIKYLRAELKLKEFRTNRLATTNEAANLLGGMVYNTIRSVGGVAHFLIGGVDNEGVHLYDLFPDGSLTEMDDNVASGSGSVFAYGVLESQYKKDMSKEEGVKLAIRCVNAALQRDSASGQGIDVYTIDKNGVKEAYSEVLVTTLKQA